MSTKPTTVYVDAASHRYAIHIGEGMLNHVAWQPWAARDVLIVSNTVVAPRYLEPLQTRLPQAKTLVLPDGEQEKSLHNAERIWQTLMQARFSRDVVLVALGGGVIGDLTGFAAACYMRGVEFITVPTTLLAQVDASVGGKTAINHDIGKNLIGAFHQPAAVFVDLNTLHTLSARDYQAGLAEVLKYGLLGDADFVAWLGEHAPAIATRDRETLSEVVRYCCEAKAAVVAADEREHGQRALLNLGHTFGHALEKAGRYGELNHGEAVAVGLHAAAWLSAELGMINAKALAQAQRALTELRLPTRAPRHYDADTLLDAMAVDKKNVGGRKRLVLLEAIGKATLCDAPDDALLRATFRAIDAVA